MNLDLPNPSTGDPIKAADIRKLSRALHRLMPRSSASIRVIETANGVNFETIQQNSLGSQFVGSWNPTISGPTNNKLSLSAGSISDGITTFIPVVDDLNLNSGMNYVYLRSSVSRIDQDGYTIGGTITAVSIEISSSAQASTSTYGRILLCTIDKTTTPITIQRYQWFNFTAQIRTSPYFYYWYS